MSVQANPTADGSTAVGTDIGVLPEMPSLASLFGWLDDQPGFIETNAGQIHVADAYDVTGRKSFDSQSDVATAWAEMQFPAHNVIEHDGRLAAELYTLSSYTVEFEGPTVRQPMFHMGGMVEQRAKRWVCNECDWSSRPEPATRDSPPRGVRNHEHDDFHTEVGRERTESAKNYRALQYPDGTGLIEHYDSTEAVRTRSGLVIRNSQCWSKGQAHCTWPRDETDVSLPLSGMESMLEGDETLFDIEEVLYDEESISIFGDYDPEAEEWDYSDARVTRRGPSRGTTKVVVLSSGHAIAVVRDSTATDHYERTCAFRLEPDQVRSLRMAEDVTRSLLKPIEVSQFEADYDAPVVPADEFQFSGGAQGYYDAERLGDVVVRQGEWYFIPMDEDFEPESAIAIRSHPPGSSARWDVSSLPGVSQVDGVPAECAGCGATRFDVDGIGAVCKDCGHEHYSASWTRMDADEQPFDPDVLGNHAPRELAVVDGDVYVRGSVRHLNSEHSMVNFRDRWHLAVENTLDGVVLDMSRPDSTTGRSASTAGVARVE